MDAGRPIRPGPEDGGERLVVWDQFKRYLEDNIYFNQQMLVQCELCSSP